MLNLAIYKISNKRNSVLYFGLGNYITQIYTHLYKYILCILLIVIFIYIIYVLNIVIFIYNITLIYTYLYKFLIVICII